MYFHLRAGERHIINEQCEEHWPEETGFPILSFPSKSVDKNLFLYIVKCTNRFMGLEARLVISKNKTIY